MILLVFLFFEEKKQKNLVKQPIYQFGQTRIKSIRTGLPFHLRQIPL